MWQAKSDLKAKILCGGVLLSAVAAFVGFIGRPAYLKHRESRAVIQADQFLVKGDYRSASLCARQALQRNPANLRANEIMAELADISRSPLLVHWREKVAEINPAITNKLLLAAASMRCQPAPFPIATQVLEELSPSATNLAAYHCLTAELALKLKQPGAAEASFAAAARLEPTNELYQLNLSVLRLSSTNTAVAASARTSLASLANSSSTGPPALRWLVSDAINRHDLSSAQHFSTQLLRSPGATVDDKLEHLSLLKESSSPEFEGFLASLRSAASTNAVQAYALCKWMNAHGMNRAASDWVAGLPSAVKAEQPLPLGIVDCYVTARDWPGLDLFLQDKAWGELEFLRYAYLSQAALNQHQDRAAQLTWTLAVQKAGDRKGALAALLTVAYGSQPDRAREELLWKIGRKFPGERWALRELEGFYLKSRNTASLHEVYAAMSGNDPRNYYARNNFAATGLLLRRNLTEAHETARELYQAHPDVPVIVSTYAYSLHLRGETKAGVALLEKLAPSALELPGVGLYFGALLAADEQPTKARKYLDLARKSELLPEEERLLDDSDRRLNPQ